MKKIIILIFILSSSIAFCQQNKQHFEEFISNFPIAKLPDTIRFSDDEFEYNYFIPGDDGAFDDSIKTNIDTTLVDTSKIKYRSEVKIPSENLEIDFNDVKLYLYCDSDNIYKDLRDLTELDSAYLKFYCVSNYITNRNFICLVFQRYFGWNNSEKYLCTLTKSGKFIDKILIASGDSYFSSILGTNYKIPWFPEEYGFINKSLKIDFFKVWNDEHIFYQIDNNGRIRKLK